MKRSVRNVAASDQLYSVLAPVVERFREISEQEERITDDRAFGEESDDKFMRHLAQVVRNGLGDRPSTCIDPKTQIVQGRTVCVVSCQRSPEPVFLKWKEMAATPGGDFFVRSGPGTVKLPPDSADAYIRTRFPGYARTADSPLPEDG